MSFFEQNPQFGSIRSDKEQDVLDALREKVERIDQVMSESLLGECQDCGALTQVLLGWCNSCHDTWKVNANVQAAPG